MKVLGRKTQAKTSKVDVRVVLRIKKIQLEVTAKDTGKMYWLRSNIKRGSHSQLTKGYLAKFQSGSSNIYEAVFPEKEQYIQEKSKFEVAKRIEEKMATFLEKTASYEIQCSNKNDT